MLITTVVLIQQMQGIQELFADLWFILHAGNYCPLGDTYILMDCIANGNATSCTTWDHACSINFWDFINVCQETSSITIGLTDCL
jgi:hypothetical protein